MTKWLLTTSVPLSARHLAVPASSFGDCRSYCGVAAEMEVCPSQSGGDTLSLLWPRGADSTAGKHWGEFKQSSL